MRFFPVFFAVAMLVAIVGASFVLSSPGVDPLPVVIPPGVVISPPDYMCVSVLPGRPAAQLVALLAPDMPGYVAQP